MRLSSAAKLLTVLISPAAVSAAYRLEEDLSGSSFLSGFNFFSGADPTHGFVRYLNENDARAQGLVSLSGSSISIGVDSKNQAPNGRASVRLESKKLYNHGLFILDLAHMPSSTCGTWPAFWMFGPDKQWPINGEIDIIEGVHLNTANHMSLHTNDGCSIDGNGMSGSPLTKNCYIHAPDQSENSGCGISSSSPRSFGTPFNQDGGGVYAMEWTSSFIKIWSFPRNALPSDIRSDSPNPATWGLPQANFAGACNIDQHFINHRIVLDTTFCGDWAGSVWGNIAECYQKAPKCDEFVNRNPGAFVETYWRINSLRIFRQ